MKESKPVRLKSKGTLTPGEIDIEKEIELLKQKLKKSQKKYNDEKKLRESLTNHNHGLLKKVSYLEERNKLEMPNTKFWRELYSGLLSVTEKSTNNYCAFILGSEKFDPDSIDDIEYHKSELEKIINILSSLVKETDLLARHKISEFLGSRN